MALTATNAQSTHNGTNVADGGTYTFPSYAYQNNKLYILFTNNGVGTAETVHTVTVTGGGITWVEVSPAGGALYAGDIRRIQCFRGYVTSGASTGTLTIQLNSTGFTCLCMDAQLTEIDGHDTSGTNGSGAIVQSAVETPGGSGTNLTLTFGSALGTDNRPLAFASHRRFENCTEESGWTLLETGSQNSPATGTITMWHETSNDQTATPSWTTSGNRAGFGVELKVATGVTVTADSWHPAIEQPYVEDAVAVSY